MLYLYYFVLWGLLGMGFPQGAWGIEPISDMNFLNPDTSQMLEDIQILSSRDFQGRQAGTEGGRQSAAFVAKRFLHLGLKPPTIENSPTDLEVWYQKTSIVVSAIPGNVQLEVSDPSRPRKSSLENLKPGSDFLPVLDSPSAHVEAPLVFVGYGISDPARGVDDYEGVDVQNRVVMFLRGKPSNYPKWVTHEDKVQTAQENGAVGFLTATGPKLNAYEARRGMGHTPLALYSFPTTMRPLPGVWVSGDVAQTMFSDIGESLSTIQTQLNSGGVNQMKRFPWLVAFNWERVDQVGTMVNVLGWLQGEDPVLREEAIVIGAHRDHFGHQAGLLFAGADDNASGTAVLLEIARILTTLKSKLKRSVLLVSFSGEERGLLGSTHYVSQPTHPLQKTVSMINIDHVGVGNGKLTVGVSLLPKSVGKEAATLVGLQEQVTVYGYFPGGDHVPFKDAGVPTLAVVSSGKHAAFHQPHDTVEQIEPNILKIATNYSVALTLLLANTP